MAASPIRFTRGASFNALLKIPTSIPDGFFANWTLRCQVRKAGSELSTGFIGEVSVSWIDPLTTRTIAIKHDATDNWPLGGAEFDVLFVSPNGEKMYTQKIAFTIQRGVTKNG